MKRLFLSIAGVLGCLCSAVSAQSVRVDLYQGTNSTPSSSWTESSGSNFTIDTGHLVSRVCVYTDGGGSAANLGAISVITTDGTARSGELQFILMNRPANLSFPDKSADLSPVAADWAGLSFDTGTAPYATVSGSIGGDLTGAVTANRIVRVEVGGELSGAVTATLSSGEAVGWVEAASSTSGGTIAATDGDIGRVVGTSTSGTLAGAISAINGHIADVLASGSINITSGGIKAQDGIDNISAKSIAGDITANANGGTGSILSIYVSEGDLDGSVAAQDLGYDYYQFGYFLDVPNGVITGELHFSGGVYLGIRATEGDACETSAHGIGSLIIDGSLYGTVYACLGMDSIVIGGNLQPGGNFPGIPGIYTPGSIGSIRVDGSITRANIKASSIGDFDAGPAVFDHVGVYGSSPLAPLPIENFHIRGNLTGGTIMVTPSGTFVVDGSFLNNTTETSELDFGSVAADVVARFGGGLEGFARVLDSGGLEGQVVINALDSTYGWSHSFVIVGSATLSPSYYSNLSSTLGGGAVGLVPYHLHATDCLPANYARLCYDSSAFEYGPNGGRQTIVLRFYGPVLDGTDDSTPPVIVSAAPENDPDNPSDITAYCDIAIAPAGHPREVWISPKSSAPFHDDFYSNSTYIVITVTPRQANSVNDLRCSGTFAQTPPAVAGFEYVVSPICTP